MPRILPPAYYDRLIAEAREQLAMQKAVEARSHRIPPHLRTEPVKRAAHPQGQSPSTVRPARQPAPAQRPSGRWFAQEGSRGGVHDYTTHNVVCRDAAAASPSQRADQLSRFAYPGQNPERPAHHNSTNLVWDRRNRVPLPGGWVRTTVSPDGQSIRNRTTPAHVFRGTVDRRLVEINGQLAVISRGRGDSPMLGFDRINQRQGALLMNHMDQAMARSMAKKIPGC